MTEFVFRDDPYARACRARVVSVTPAGIELDRTVFYPASGQVSADKARLDFDIDMERLQKEAIEEGLNRRVVLGFV